MSNYNYKGVQNIASARNMSSEVCVKTEYSKKEVEVISSRIIDDLKRILDKDVVKSSIDKISLFSLKSILDDELNLFSLSEKVDAVVNVLLNDENIFDANLTIHADETEKNAVIRAVSKRSDILAKILSPIVVLTDNVCSLYEEENNIVTSKYIRDKDINRVINSNEGLILDLFEETGKVADNFGCGIAKNQLLIPSINSSRVGPLNLSLFYPYLDENTVLGLTASPYLQEALDSQSDYLKPFFNNHIENVSKRIPINIKELPDHYRGRVLNYLKK